MSFQNCKVNAQGVSAVAYHDGKGERGSKAFRMSPSSLKAFMQSPSRWRKGYSLPDSAARRWGTLLDLRLLTPERFKADCVVQPALYESEGMECPVCHSLTESKSCAKCKVDRVKVSIKKDWNNGSETCKAWTARQAGKEVISDDENKDTKTAVERILSDEILSAFHNASDTQVHVVGEWHDKATGLIIPVECLIDYVPRTGTEFATCAGDLKSTTNAGLRPFNKWIYTAGYHIQAAFDLDLFNAASGEARDTWVFVLSENYAPWETGRRMLSQEYLELGKGFYRAALTRYAQCLATDTWPTYDDNKDALQGWSLCMPESWMNYETVSEVMETTSTEPEFVPSESEIIP